MTLKTILAVQVAVVALISGCSSISPQSGTTKLVTVSTLAGSGIAGTIDGKDNEARLNRPHGLATTMGGAIVFADRGNNQVRQLRTDGVVVTIAGSGKAGFAGGKGASAEFNEPIAVVTDRQGNIYVADRNNHRIRRITPDGTVKTLAGSSESGFVDGHSSLARFNQPYGVALDDAEITLYVADYLNHAIRKIDLLSDEVSTLAGNGKAGFEDGSGSGASFNQPYNLKNDGHGMLIVPDQNNHAIRRVGMNGVVTTLAGSGAAGYADGKGREAKFNNPTGAVVASDGTVLVADRNNHRIRRIAPDGTVTTIAGTGEAAFVDGPAMEAKFNRPLDVDVSRDGKLVISEENNHRIRAIAP
jgi:DNA-binding beta-propeller fold protein YncE